MMNKVYIVLVNYNNWRDTIECLESLLKLNYINFQIFLIDNSDDDTSLKKLSAWANGNQDVAIKTNYANLVFPLVQKPVDYTVLADNEFIDSEHLITIVKTTNNGFAAANNIALKHILKTAPNDAMIWVLNNDTVVDKDALSNLVASCQKNIEKKYIYGCTLRYYYKPDVIQAVAGYYNTWLGKHHHIGDGEIDNGQYINYQPAKNNYIVGASIFLPKSFLAQAGLMCEDYFLYFEEMDWINEGKKHGFRIVLVPNAIVYHKEGASIIGDKQKKNDTSFAEYYSIVSRVRFIKKWYPINLITVMGGVTAALVKRILQGKFKLVKKTTVAVFKVLFSGNSQFIKK